MKVIRALALLLLLPAQPGVLADEALTFGNEALVVVAGDGKRVPDGLRLAPDRTGLAIVALPVSTLAAGHYGFLQVKFTDLPTVTGVTLRWLTGGDVSQVLEYRFPATPRRTLWIPLQQLPGWRGELRGVALAVALQPGESLVLSELRLLPFSLALHLRAATSNALTHSGWSLGSNNDYQATVVSGSPALYPVFILGCILLLGGAAFLAVNRHLLRRPPLRVEGLATAGVVLWLLVDLPWQRELLHRVALTQAEYPGSTTEEKRSAGLEGDLFRFTTAAKDAIAGDGARVFVVSETEFFRLQAAYFLYPRNVFWQRGPVGALPASFLRPGDYIALIGATRERLAASGDRLHIPAAGTAINVETVVAHNVARLLRVI